MDLNIEVGKYYRITRILGKATQGTVVVFDTKEGRITLKNTTGTATFDISDIGKAELIEPK